MLKQQSIPLYEDKPLSLIRILYSIKCTPDVPEQPTVPAKTSEDSPNDSPSDVEQAADSTTNAETSTAVPTTTTDSHVVPSELESHRMPPLPTNYRTLLQCCKSWLRLRRRVHRMTRQRQFVYAKQIGKIPFPPHYFR
mmetsp:Transcript_23158/g.57130  ORF Transcript_23158/g.57130 Transcript_23158/m.57130 type:complete len:138 (-) Transcript_23158:2591-3004(-)